MNHSKAVCETRRPTKLGDPATPVGLMQCPMTTAHWSLVTVAMASLEALANARQKCLSCASQVTVADVSPGTIAIQSPESRCQELVLWQGQRLASDTANDPSPVALARSSLQGIAISINPARAMLD